MPKTARIALNRPLRRLFDYLVPEEMTLSKGQRVTVPFGRRSAVGLVTATDQPPPPGVALKRIESCCEDWPALPTETLDLLTWASHYYQHPLGECLFTALPSSLRRGQPARRKQQPRWQLCGNPAELPSNAKRQRALMDWLADRTNSATNQEIIQAGFTHAQIRSLREKALVEEATPEAQPMSSDETVAMAQPTLSDAQLRAAAQLPNRNDGFSAALLFGITGSGKTEVYLHYLANTLSPEDQALVLVPEINLTPQTVARFEKYFGQKVLVWHSALNDAERLDAWLRIRDGEPVIVIGTRSSVLLPFVGLKTIIVDEEHDSSFKQGEGFRYSGRDVAVYRAQLNRCPVILGSATPSLESYHNAISGKYRLIKLEERAGSARPPDVQLLDIRSRPLKAGLSRPALAAIERCLRAGQQALVFVNRRGFAPIIMCFDCGHMAECPRCDTRLTLHRRDNALRCHHCDFQSAAPPLCPKCQSDAFKPVGQGTERAEEYLQEHFPETPVVRVDRDSTQRKGSIQGILKQVNSGKPCILVGTQMLAKGHDFPNVTLVVVVNADGGLFSVDFRAPEQMTQILIQVSGRAGRGKDPGQVLIQTCHSDHPLLVGLSKGRYLPIADQLLHERETSELPPYRSLAVLRAEAQSMADSLTLLDRVKSHLTDPNIHCWGPLPAVIARKADRHRAQLVLISPGKTRLNHQLTALCQILDQSKLPGSTKWTVDVDAMETG